MTWSSSRQILLILWLTECKRIVGGLVVETEKARKEKEADENMNNDKKDGWDGEDAAPIITTMDEMMFGDMEKDDEDKEET